MADYGGDHRRGGVGAIGDASAGPGLHDRRVYIGQLPFAIDSVNKLAELLHDRGIKDHDVLKVPVSPEDGRARGFAFASFTTVAAATKCIELLDQSNVDGRIVTCTRSYKQDAPMRTGPGQGGYMPPAMEVTGVNKGESQWEVLARIQARYGVAMPAAEPTAAAHTTHHHPTIENGGVIPPPPPPGAPQTILPKISSLAAVVGRDAARRATGRDAGTMNAPASNDDDDGTVPPPPPPGGPPIPSQTGFSLATDDDDDDDDDTPPPPPPPGCPPTYTTGLTQPRVARVPSRRPGVDAGPSLVKLEKAGKRERMRKLRASGVFLMGDASEDDDKDDDTDDRAAAAAPHAAAPHAKRARVLEEVHAVTGEARPEDLVRYESYQPAELAPSKIDEIRARAAAAAARAAAKSAGMF